MVIPEAHLTIDGHPMRMEDDWSATADADGGYDRFSARVPLESIRKFSLGQESQAVLYDDSAEVLWWGKLTQDPHVENGIASIDAEGPQADAEKEAGRLLYQTRSTDVWQDRESEPLVFDPTTQTNLDVSQGKGHLLFKAPRGETVTLGDAEGFALWAPGTPGGIQRYAFTIRRNRDSSGLNLRVTPFDGPVGPGSFGTIRSHGLASGNPLSVNQVITDGKDALSFVLFVNTSATVGAQLIVRVFSLRVNGIWGNTGRAGSYDTMYVDEGVTDVFSRLGWGASVEQKDTNVLPLDWEGGTFAELVAYLSGLVDYVWLAPLHPGGNAIFRDWGNTVHPIRHGIFDLAKLRIYNKATVPYESVAGAPLEASAVPVVDSLPGVTREYVHSGLSDPQPNANLATNLAQTLADLTGSVRFAGTAHIPRYDILPGDEILHENHGPGESRTHRVWATSLSRSGTVVTIEDQVSVENLIELAGLRGQRRKTATRRPTKKQRRRAREQARKLRRRLRRERRELVKGFHESLSPKERRRRIERWKRRNPPVRL